MFFFWSPSCSNYRKLKWFLSLGCQHTKELQKTPISNLTWKPLSQIRNWNNYTLKVKILGSVGQVPGLKGFRPAVLFRLAKNQTETGSDFWNLVWNQNQGFDVFKVLKPNQNQDFGLGFRVYHQKKWCISEFYQVVVVVGSSSITSQV